MIRLIVDEPLSGSRNMAIDQALLQSAAESGTSTLRVYRWQPATVSLGYFQSWQCRSEHLASHDCPLVRRASGGGAIVHDQEMTYSLALPSKDRWASQNRGLFDTVHQTLIECLGEFGITGCKVFGETEAKVRAATQAHGSPFLCFQRRAPGDVVIDGHKVIGSAQRRLDKALLQHGSVLIRQSKFAPELPGICDLNSSVSISVASLIESWPKCLARQMTWSLTPSQLTESEHRRADDIESAKFGNPIWTQKR